MHTPLETSYSSQEAVEFRLLAKVKIVLSSCAALAEFRGWGQQQQQHRNAHRTHGADYELCQTIMESAVDRITWQAYDVERRRPGGISLLDTTAVDSRNGGLPNAFALMTACECLEGIRQRVPALRSLLAVVCRVIFASAYVPSVVASGPLQMPNSSRHPDADGDDGDDGGFYARTPFFLEHARLQKQAKDVQAKAKQTRQENEQLRREKWAASTNEGKTRHFIEHASTQQKTDVVKRLFRDDPTAVLGMLTNGGADATARAVLTCEPLLEGLAQYPDELAAAMGRWGPAGVLQTLFRRYVSSQGIRGVPAGDLVAVLQTVDPELLRDTLLGGVPVHFDTMAQSREVWRALGDRNPDMLFATSAEVEERNGREACSSRKKQKEELEAAQEIGMHFPRLMHSSSLKLLQSTKLAEEHVKTLSAEYASRGYRLAHSEPHESAIDFAFRDNPEELARFLERHPELKPSLAHLLADPELIGQMISEAPDLLISIMGNLNALPPLDELLNRPDFLETVVNKSPAFLATAMAKLQQEGDAAGGGSTGGVEMCSKLVKQCVEICPDQLIKLLAGTFSNVEPSSATDVALTDFRKVTRRFSTTRALALTPNFVEQQHPSGADSPTDVPHDAAADDVQRSFAASATGRMAGVAEEEDSFDVSGNLNGLSTGTAGRSSAAKNPSKKERRASRFGKDRFHVPDYWQRLLRSNASTKRRRDSSVLSLRALKSLILTIYVERSNQSRASASTTSDLPRFTTEYMLKKFGSKKLVQQRLAALIAALQSNRTVGDSWITSFSRFCGLITPVYPASTFELYMQTLESVRPRLAYPKITTWVAGVDLQAADEALSVLCKVLSVVGPSEVKDGWTMRREEVLYNHRKIGSLEAFMDVCLDCITVHQQRERETLGAVFRKFDKDASGTLDLDEWKLLVGQCVAAAESGGGNGGSGGSDGVGSERMLMGEQMPLASLSDDKMCEVRICAIDMISTCNYDPSFQFH